MKGLQFTLTDGGKDWYDPVDIAEFEELSDAGVPTKPVGIRIRNVNEKTWEATE